MKAFWRLNKNSDGSLDVEFGFSEFLMEEGAPEKLEVRQLTAMQFLIDETELPTDLDLYSIHVLEGYLYATVIKLI